MNKQLFRFTESEIDGTYKAEIRTTKLFENKYDRHICCNVSLELNGEYTIERTEKDADYPKKMKINGLDDMVNDFIERVMIEIEHAKITNNVQ